MTKIIRKYSGYEEDEPIFNSNYLFVPIYFCNNQKKKLIHINIYDICRIKKKIKGIL